MTIRGDRHGTALLAIRKRSGKTQLVVAEALGLSKSTYSAWETGRISLNTEHIISLCNYFGCTPNDLLGFDDVPTGVAESLTYTTLAEEERHVLDLFNRLTASNKASILDIMQSCAKRRRARLSQDTLKN